MDFASETNIGRVRQVNQDRANVVENDRHQLLAVVCDGMGGHQAGEEASSMAIKELISAFKAEPGFDDIWAARKWLLECIAKANALIYADSQANANHHGMGTTVVLALVIDDQMCVCHVGDSRAYLFAQSELKQLTQDHTYVNLLVESGSINREQALHHPQKNVLMKALGVFEKIVVTHQVLPFHEGVLLLCSDGLYNCLNEGLIKQILESHPDARTICHHLIHEANARGGYDNIGVALIIKGGKSHA